jgi:Transposase DDE domain
MLEAGVEPQARRRGIPPKYLGAFPATLIGSWKERFGPARGFRGFRKRRLYCQALQATFGLDPLYADGAYISGQAIQEAEAEGWQLVGPAQPSAARKDLAKQYGIEAFDISITERKALCPAGKTSTNCSKLTEEKSGKLSYRFEFGRQCHGCPHRPACVPRDQAHRTIVVGACHEALQQLRREQLSPEFELRMHQRNAIEGTISELL